MQQPLPSNHGPDVVSPFAQSRTTLPEAGKSKVGLALWSSLGLILVAAGSVFGIYLAGRLNDPLRTLEGFPVAKYLEGHRALAGAKFKGELRVEADLGWKEGIGRLMVFTASQDNRPVVVMIPAQFSNIYFTKGQSYLAELEVKEGGLIYANSCRKN